MFRGCVFYALAGAVILLAIFVGGCTQISGTTPSPSIGTSPATDTGTPVISPAAMDIANATAERIMQSLNSGDFSQFTTNFSDHMLALNNNESSFKEHVVAPMQYQFGNYVSKTGPEISMDQGNNLFKYTCTGTKGNIKLWLGMNTTNASSVERITFEFI